MTLPISTVVNVTISTSQGIPPKAGFGIMGLLSQELMKGGVVPSGNVLYYGGIDEVAEMYESTSNTYLQAQSYFSASPRPDTIAILYHEIRTTVATLTCGDTPLTDVPTWDAITDGSFTVSMSSGSEEITGMDFTGVADMDAVAGVIELALQATGGADFTASACNFSATDSVFVITSGDTGASAVVSFLTANVTGTDISSLMKGLSADGGTSVDGTAPLTAVDALSDAENYDNGWYGLCVSPAHRDTQVAEDIADWAAARIKWYSACTNDPTTLQSNTTHFASSMRDQSQERTSVVYSSHADEFPECAILGRAFIVDFSAPDSTITMKFKNLPGITVEKVSAGQKAILDDYRCNAMIVVGGANMFAEGFMSYNMFMDTRHGLDWLQGEIESNTFGYLLGRPTKVPLTDAGATSLENQVIRSLDTALLNGLVGTGTTVDGLFLAKGYITTVQKVADMNIADKAQRIAPTISFIAILAGAVHSVQVNGVVER